MNETDLGSRPCRLTRRGFLWHTLQAAVLCAALVSTTVAAPVKGVDVGGKRGIDVYTVNAYIGADLTPALMVDPTNPAEVLAVTTQLYINIANSRPELRMWAIAADIAARQPDVVGGVELYTLELAPALPTGIPGDFSVAYDYLGLLSQALADMGSHYRVAVVSKESEVTLPLLNPMNLQQVLFGRITDSEAILVRSDLPPGYLRVSNPQTGQYTTHIVLPDTGVELKRGWSSVDAFVRGERFRVVCTHLEDEAAPPIQYAQALELLSGPADTSMPVILLGDFNADPLGRNGTATYPLFAQAGFTDSWLQLNPSDPAGGLTWGHDAFLADPSNPLEWRLDLILYRGTEFTPTDSEVIDLSTGRSLPPLWGSDHEALTTSFMLGNPR